MLTVRLTAPSLVHYAGVTKRLEAEYQKSNPCADYPKRRLRKGFNKGLLTSTRMMFTMALDLRLDTWGMRVWKRGEQC